MSLPSADAPTSHTTAGLASTLAVSVGRLSRRLRQERDSSLTATQLSALGTLQRHGPLSLGALAASERVQPPSMTRTVHCLEEAGMVARRAHPDDRRQVVLRVSERGLDLLDSERRRRDAWLAQRLDSYSAEQRELLRQALPLLDELAQW